AEAGRDRGRDRRISRDRSGCRLPAPGDVAASAATRGRPAQLILPLACLSAACVRASWFAAACLVAVARSAYRSDALRQAASTVTTTAAAATRTGRRARLAAARSRAI